MEEKAEVIKNVVTKNERERSQLVGLYMLFFFSLFITVIPVTPASVFSFMLSVCTIAGLYSIRLKTEEDSLLENHMTFMIRTFWRSFLVFLSGAFIGLLFLLASLDYTPIAPCGEVFFNALNRFAFTTMAKTIDICGELLYEENVRNFTITALIAFSPVLLYLVYRCVIGWVALMQHKLIAKKKL